MDPITAPFSSTYRIQFHKEFTFADLKQIQDYLEQLGIGAVYASPVFKAAPESSHGYDVVDAARINPELGNGKRLNELILQLKQRGIGWVQDIVPNHMGFHPENPWLMDLLEKGDRSVHAAFFDTALSSPFFQGRLMVPFLGSSLDEAIEKRELQIGYRNFRFVIIYHDQVWPLGPSSYRYLLPEGIPLAEQLMRMEGIKNARAYSLQWDDFRLQLTAYLKTVQGKRQLNRRIREINGDPAHVKELADRQFYRLCSWRETDTRVNYRRFFTINGLICLNMQKKGVFRQYHKLIAALLKEELFSGLRVDHIDGLFDPAGYLQQLRELAGTATWIVVEKILEKDEKLPGDWPVQGTTGYEFLALVNNLFTWEEGRKTFSGFYRHLNDAAVDDQVREKKAAILWNQMQGELECLCGSFRKLLRARGNPPHAGADVDDTRLKEALAAFLVYCPVYRYYSNRLPLPEGEAAALRQLFGQIRTDRPDLHREMELMEEALLNRPLQAELPYNRLALHFYQRCMQFSGPLMAKGMEDTLMYTYHRFIAHNEVGDSPDAFGIGPARFHEAMLERARCWPQALNATATHDTKRGEDVRARLNALSCFPDEWIAAVRQWQHMNRKLKKKGFPDGNDEYFIYQTLAGAWSANKAEEAGFPERLRNYLMKAVREAKVHSSWSDPDAEYEEAITGFATALLDNSHPFRRHFLQFMEQVWSHGRFNSLAQLLLKCTCPGIPDIYQGCELWDFSLVDPDNRRPVDFSLRTRWLAELEQSKPALASLWRKSVQDETGAGVKLWLTRHLLNERRREPVAFLHGQYIPLTVSGIYRDHLLAFARRHDKHWYVTVVPLHPARLCRVQETDLIRLDWKDTQVLLPAEAPAAWQQTFDQTTGVALEDANGKQAIPVKAIFQTYPLALLKLSPPPEDRSAGMLLHLTSLPHPRFGTGDLGDSARDFAGFLSRAGQRYWQLLPLNPVAPEYDYSPYSPVSAMAGNPLLISPEQLAAEGWLTEKDLEEHSLAEGAAAGMPQAFNEREQLLQKAWQTFSQKSNPAQQKRFRAYCIAEKDWLTDFALFVTLKREHGDRPWHEWPAGHKLRDPVALNEFAAKNASRIHREKWLQFVFASQWKTLRNFCGTVGIRMLGDLPFYISYNSADVWSNREIFSLDAQGRMEKTAGVPPDYFNREGQLWNMPVFRWDVLRRQNYHWWVRRIRKNMDWYDLLRLDHFRAFSAYWEIPAGKKTAMHGRWKPGPGARLFHTLYKKLGKLPFLAEDLGEIDQDVYRLRDQFGFPGMKVLQFAFGEDLPRSPHIPHLHTAGFVVYTGTHDNNTTRGWYESELDDPASRRLAAYAGNGVHAGNVHRVLARLAFASVARTAILPVQDLLGLDRGARMNTPAMGTGNWQWRLLPGQLTTRAERELLKLTRRYGRA